MVYATSSVNQFAGDKIYAVVLPSLHGTEQVFGIGTGFVETDTMIVVGRDEWSTL